MLKPAGFILQRHRTAGSRWWRWWWRWWWGFRRQIFNIHFQWECNRFFLWPDSHFYRGWDFYPPMKTEDDDFWTKSFKTFSSLMCSLLEKKDICIYCMREMCAFPGWGGRVLRETKCNVFYEPLCPSLCLFIDYLCIYWILFKSFWPLYSFSGVVVRLVPTERHSSDCFKPKQTLVTVFNWDGERGRGEM